MPWVFDGRDITDVGETGDEVLAYHLCICHVCGTLRDARFPFCCELAAFVPPEASRRALAAPAVSREASVVTPDQSERRRGKSARHQRGR
jgi:hypothetical protein